MLEKETKILFDSITNQDSIHKMTELIQRKIFKNPVMVFNTYFRLLSLSSDVEFSDEVWNYAIEHHCCSKESIESFKNDQASSLLFEKGDAFLYNTNLGKNIPRILGRIRVNKQTYGYLVIFEVNNPVREIDLKKANLVCSALSILLSRDNDANSQREYFYKEILDMDTSNRLEVENEIHQAKWDYKEDFVALTLKSKDKFYLTYICSQINKIDYDVTAFIYKNQILVVCNFNREDEYQLYIKSIETICKDNGLDMGMSHIFSNLVHLPIYASQAMKAREIGRYIDQNKIIYPYSKYTFYDLLRNLDEEEIKAMRCKEYKILKEYDKHNETELLQTCIMYFLHSSNVTITSKVLGIHRNTLNNRLIRIEELIHNTMQNIELVNQIYISYSIDQWIDAVHVS